MKILENTFSWNGEIFIFHFRKLENVFRKFWKTTKISFLIYIEVRKQKIFISLKNLWKVNEPNAFSKFSFSVENFLGKLKIFPQPNAPLIIKKIYFRFLLTLPFIIIKNTDIFQIPKMLVKLLLRTIEDEKWKTIIYQKNESLCF